MHQIRAVSLYSYLDVARFSGVDGFALLNRAGISPTTLDDPHARIPAAPAIRLLEQSAAEAKCDSFGIKLAECRSFASLGPLSVLLERLDTIQDVLGALIDRPRTLSDVLFVALETNHEVALATFGVLSPFSRPQAADLTVGLGYLALAGASAGRWTPEAVHFAHGEPEDRGTFERFFRAPLVFNSHFNGFSFPRERLRISLPLADREMASNVRRLMQPMQLSPVRTSFADHVRHSISLLLAAGRANLAEVAANLDLSPRALQRKLRDEQHTFAVLLNDARRELVQRRLRSSDLSLTQIAQDLGYSDLSSFTRWFDREFDVPPSVWRKDQQVALASPPPMWRR